MGVEWNVIDGIIPRGKFEQKLLQLADCAASAAFAALTPDAYGNCEPGYITVLKNHLYRRNGNLFSYGFKLFPDGGALLAERPGYEWLKGLQIEISRLRTPGSHVLLHAATARRPGGCSAHAC